MPEQRCRPVLRYGSHNPNGLTTIAVVGQAAAAWQQAGFDIVFLQEHHLTFATRTRIQRCLLRHGWRAFLALSPTGASGRGRAGTAILIRRELLDRQELTVVGGDAAVQLGPEGRYTALPVRWCGHHLHLCSIYLPSGDPAAQRDYITSHLSPLAAAAQAAGRHLVWGGDFNFVPDPLRDRLMLDPAAAAAHPDVGTQRRWAECLPVLADAWRQRHPSRRGFTYVSGTAASRLDRFYVSSVLLPRVAVCSISSRTVGDHRPVSLSLVGLQPSALGPPRARVRVDFASSPPLLQAFKDWLDEQLALAPADDLGLLVWWPLFKRDCADKCAALQRARRLEAQGARVEGEELAAVLAQLDAGDSSALPAVLAARQRFAEAMAAEEAEQALCRRQAWVHAGERPGLALSRRFRPRVQDSQVPALRDAGGRVVHQGTACAQLAARTYARVSAQPVVDVAARQEVLQALAGGRHFSAGQAAALGAAAVSPDEVGRALRTAPPGRSPGLDGIPVELYRRFKDSFLPILARLFTAVGTLGQLPAGFTEGLITILFKSGDRADPKCYRPITLLCTDYRLYAKVLALRLNPCLPDVIDREQTGFVPGRRIGENVMALQCLAQLLRRQGRWAVAVFCDFYKAYDTIDRTFLISAMRELGVGEAFLSYVRLLLADTRARATVNRWVSTPEVFAAGVRQGCPLAPLLYLFVAQALLRLLKVRGVGIQAAGMHLTAFQYADDAEALLPSFDALPAFLDAMAVFRAGTGQGLNRGKTRVLPIGAVPADLPASSHGLAVVTSAAALGITHSSDGCPSTDWAGLQATVEGSFARVASLRRLSVFGRGFASAAYGVSRMLYHAEFAGHPPPAVLAELDRATARLVDGGLPPRPPTRRFAGVACDLLPGRPAEGGFGALAWREHISSRHAWWGLQLLLAPECVPWVAIGRALLIASAEEFGSHPMGLLVWPADQPLPGTTSVLPLPLRRLHAGLASLPRVSLVGGLEPGPWCWAAPLWGNPLLSSAAYPNGVDLDFFDFAAAGINTFGDLLHLEQALAAVPSQAAYHLVWATQLRRSYAFAQRHVASERLAALLAALPLSWVHAARGAAAAIAAGQLPPPQPADAVAAIVPCLGWERQDGSPLLLAAYTVRGGTALLSAPRQRRRLLSYFSPYAAAAAGAAHDGAAEDVLAALRRLWRVRCENRLKEPFWRLAHDGLPTAARQHVGSPCACGAPDPSPGRLHHYWACPVARAVIDSVSAAVGAPVPRAAIWLARAPAGVHASVWCLVCLAAVAAMDHGRRVLYAVSHGPPVAGPVHAAAATAARNRFWRHLSDFLAYQRSQPSWRGACPPGHPFFHLDTATDTLVLHYPEVAAPPPGPAAHPALP